MKLILIAALALVASAARAEQGVTDKEIVLGACAPLTGQQKEVGFTYTGGATSSTSTARAASTAAK